MLKKKLEKLGAAYSKRGAAEVPASFGDVAKELSFIRNSAAVSDFSFAGRLVFPEDGGTDFLDSVLPANILKLRYGRMINTFLADFEGNLLAEVFAADIDDRIFVICESPFEDFDAPLRNGKIKCEDISKTHAMFSVDGPLSWKVVSEIFGADALNLSYLSVDKFDFDGSPAYLMRNGKTGEFGYQVIVSADKAEPLFDKLAQTAAALGGGLAGFDAHSAARLQGNFFNVFSEGAAARNPLELGLQWMIDLSKEDFFGSKAILENRAKGVSRRLAAVAASVKISSGDALYGGAAQLGKVVAGGEIDGKYIYLALIDREFAYPEVAMSLSPNGEVVASTASRPSIIAQSLLKGMGNA